MFESRQLLKPMALAFTSLRFISIYDRDTNLLCFQTVIARHHFAAKSIHTIIKYRDCDKVKLTKARATNSIEAFNVTATSKLEPSKTLTVATTASCVSTTNNQGGL